MTAFIWPTAALTALLLVLVALMGFVLRNLVVRMAYRHFPGTIAKRHYRKLLQIATDVGVDSLQLAHQDADDDELLLVQRNIAQEAHLLGFKALRMAERARREGLREPDATILIENLERRRIANAATNAGVSFIGFTIPDSSPLMERDREGVLAFNRRMLQLKEHWAWTNEWLWQYRKTVKTPD